MFPLSILPGGEELDRDPPTPEGALDDESDYSDGAEGLSRGRAIGGSTSAVDADREDNSPVVRRRRAATGPERDLNSSNGGEQTADCCGVVRSQVCH